MTRLLTSTALVAFLFVVAAPQGTKAADPDRLKTNISTLASERFGGRLTGTAARLPGFACRASRLRLQVQLRSPGAAATEQARRGNLPRLHVSGGKVMSGRRLVVDARQ